MKELTTEELKQVQLEILCDVHEFCYKNNIHYSLAFGTLLGAIRHKGFIPWDDDIDIMMLRDDYERFITSYQSQYYKIADPQYYKNSTLPFAKVYDNRTIVEEQTRYPFDLGVNIDVFPIDNIPDNISERNLLYRKKNFWNTIHILKSVALDRNRSFVKNMILFVSYIFLSIIPISFVNKKIVKLAKQYSKNSTKHCAVFVPVDNKRRWIQSKTLFEQYLLMTFEDSAYFCVKEYDQYLKALYGDYMKLPPIEQQITHHDFKAYWRYS